MRRAIALCLFGIIAAHAEVPKGEAESLEFAPASGIWWDARQLGVGYGIQWMDGSVFVTWYTYTSAGPNTWYVTQATVTRDGDELVARAPLQLYEGGECPLCMDGEVQLVEADAVGDFELRFTGHSRGFVSINGEQVAEIRHLTAIPTFDNLAGEWVLQTAPFSGPLSLRLSNPSVVCFTGACGTEYTVGDVRYGDTTLVDVTFFGGGLYGQEEYDIKVKDEVIAQFTARGITSHSAIGTAADGSTATMVRIR